MPSGFLKNTSITVCYPIDTYSKEWTRDKIEKWITNGHGRHLQKFTENTTHVVCTQRAWKNRTGEVRAAVEAKKKGERVHIVSPDWLEDTLRNQRRCKESHFSWEKLDARVVSARKKADKETARVEKKVMGPGSGVGGMMAEVFNESTENALSEEETAVLEEQLEKEREARRQAAVEAEAEKEKQREEEKKERKEQEAIFRRGAKKAKNEIFSDNHHIYMDSTGFKYEITLTKVDTKHNRNERYVLTLQLYESNSEPATYAVNLHFAGTGKVPSNNVIAAIGCNYCTAFHSFKKVFKEKTKVEWDDRISFTVERAKREKRARGQATHSPEGTVRGVPVSEAGLEEGLRAMEAVDFGQKPFIYHPPLYGARGELPEKVQEFFAEIGPQLSQEGQDRREKAEEIGVWMSGANGRGPSPDLLDHTQTHGAGAGGVTDFEVFEKQMAAGGDGEASLSATQLEIDFDFGDGGLGDTSYPFGGDDQNFDFDTAVGGVTGAGGDTAIDHVGDQQVAAEQTEAQLERTVPETQPDSFDHTQRALDAAVSLEQFMQEAEAAARADSPVESVTLAVSTASQQAPKATGKLGGTLNLGSSMLGKRRSAPVEVSGDAAERREKK